MISKSEEVSAMIRPVQPHLFRRNIPERSHHHACPSGKSAWLALRAFDTVWLSLADAYSRGRPF